MLAAADQQAQIESMALAGVEVVLPEEWKSFFFESGYSATTADEFRGNARLRVRRVGDVLIVHTPPPLRDGLADREKRSGRVLIKDLSRSGIGILYHQQLYPEEQIQVRFQGRLINSVVVRCRRVGERCYEIGGKVVSLETINEPMPQ